MKNPGTVNVTGTGNPQSFSTETGTTTPNLEFIFTNNSEVSVTATSVQANSTGFTQTNSNCNAPIAPHQTCKVTGSFTTQTAGNYTLTATYNYTNSSGNQSAIAYIQANVKPASQPCTQILGLNGLPLPLTTYAGTDNVVKFLFTNTCSAGTPNAQLGTVNVTGTMIGSTVTTTKGPVPPAPQPPTFLDNCSGQSLAPGQSCTVFASVIPQGAGTQLQATASVSFSVAGNPGTSTVSTRPASVLAFSTTAHNLIFINQCPFPVWYGVANGNGSFPPPPPPPAVNYRYSPDPTPTSLVGYQNSANDYLLPAQVGGQPPATKVLASFTDYTNGSMWPRTGCVILSNGDLQCQSGSCSTITQPGQGVSASTGRCITFPGTGLNQPKNPYTKLEMTITPNANTDAVYDISLVGGMNTPVEFKGLGPIDLTSTTPLFTCGAAGALIQPPQYSTPGSPTTSLGPCLWSFTPPANFVNYLTYVTPGPTITDCSSCTTGSPMCGETYTSGNFNTGAEGVYINGCGKFLGYWTIADFIYTSPINFSGTDLSQPSIFNIFDTNTNAFVPLPATGPEGTSYGNSNTAPNGPANTSDMYACNTTSNGSLNSGYLIPQQSPYNLCGCIDWNLTTPNNTSDPGVPVTIPPAAVTAQAGNCTPPSPPPPAPQIPPAHTQNPDFLTLVFPNISWLKSACPTAYSFQFDDESVSFTCNPTPGGFTSYQITFCPGGRTGEPGT